MIKIIEKIKQVRVIKETKNFFLAIIGVFVSILAGLIAGGIAYLAFVLLPTIVLSYLGYLNDEAVNIIRSLGNIINLIAFVVVLIRTFRWFSLKTGLTKKKDITS